MTIHVLRPVHTSFETAFIISNYPYGFKLRCQKAIWIETATKGQGKGQQRVVTATTNPKRGNIWNKPKASTYSIIKVLFIDPETGHIESDGWNGWKTDEFLNRYRHGLTPEQLAVIESYQALEKSFDRHVAEFH